MDALRLRLVTDDTPEIRLASHHESLRWRERMPFRFVPQHEHSIPLRRAIARGRQAIIAEQRGDGSFCSPPIDDPIAYSVFVLLQTHLDRVGDVQAKLAAERLLQLQSSQGGWPRLAGEADDLSTTVLAYFALKLTGHRSNTLPMQSALQFISQAGGAATCDARARLLLAMFGQIPYRVCAAPIQQENEAAASVYTQEPTKSLPIRQGIRELFKTDPTTWPVCQWPSDLAATEFEKCAWQILALTTTDKIEQDVAQQWESLLKRFVIQDQTTSRNDNEQHDDDNDPRFLLCSCHSAIADTALALTALKTSGLSSMSPPLRDASRWLETQLASGGGNKAERTVAEAALQADEFSSHKELPPELQLWSKEGPNRVHRREVMDGTAASPFQTQGTDQSKPREMAVTKLRAAQRPDGSWVTAAGEGIRLDGRVSPVESTAKTLSALAAAGLDESDETIAAGVNWLVANQRPDGGWDEKTYASEPPFGTKPIREVDRSSDNVATTPLATASAVLALLDCEERDESVIESGIDFLLTKQSTTGGWLVGDDETSPTLDLRTTCRATEALSRWATTGCHSSDSNATTTGRSRSTEQPALRIAQLPPA